MSGKNAEAACHEVIIVGGGPAGLNAALILGRCGRDTLLIDAGRPRNEVSPLMHGFLSRDGILPRELLQIARDQLVPYPSVTYRGGKVEEVAHNEDGFSARLESGETHFAKSLILATGLIDQLPEIDNFRIYYGRSVHHCPYCDGWESRGQRIGVLGGSRSSVELALELTLWSRDITLFTNGIELEEDLSEQVAKQGFDVVKEGVASLEGSERELQGVRTKEGSLIEVQKLFFVPEQWQHSPLSAQLGCYQDPEGPGIECTTAGESSIEGVFIAGNVGTGVQMAILAAAEGLKAAIAANEWLLEKQLSA